MQPKRIGRPPGTGLPPEQKTKPHSIRLTDADWELLQQLGVSRWLIPRLAFERQYLERHRQYLERKTAR